MALNWADWILVSIVLVSCFLGFKRGLIKEALSVVILGVALFIALTYRDTVATMLSGHFQTEPIRQTVAFISLFLITLMVGTLINFAIGIVLKFSGLSTFDRLFGVGFGLARGAIVVLAVVISLSKIESVERERWWTQSALIPNVMVFDEWATQTGIDSVVWLKQFLNVG